MPLVWRNLAIVVAVVAAIDGCGSDHQDFRDGGPSSDGSTTSDHQTSDGRSADGYEDARPDLDAAMSMDSGDGSSDRSNDAVADGHRDASEDSATADIGRDTMADAPTDAGDVTSADADSAVAIDAVDADSTRADATDDASDADLADADASDAGATDAVDADANADTGFVDGDGGGGVELRACHRDGAGGNTCQTSANCSATLDQWSHVAVTWDAATEKWQLYNGGAPCSFTNGSRTGLSQTATAPLIVGSDSPTAASFFKGSIDSVRVYRRALSASGIAALFALD
jgi:hypothetical protein